MLKEQRKKSQQIQKKYPFYEIFLYQGSSMLYDTDTNTITIYRYIGSFFLVMF